MKRHDSIGFLGNASNPWPRTGDGSAPFDLQIDSDNLATGALNTSLSKGFAIAPHLSPLPQGERWGEGECKIGDVRWPASNWGKTVARNGG